MYGEAYYSCLRSATITSGSVREIQFSAPPDTSYEDQYTIHWNGSSVLQHLYGPDNTDILQLQKRDTYDYFEWGFVYVSFNPMLLANQYGIAWQGVWKMQMETVDPTTPPLCKADEFRVSIHRVEFTAASVNLPVEGVYVMNLPSVSDWYNEKVSYFYVNANSSQVDVSDSMLEYSYHGESGDYSYWHPYNKTVRIKNVWTQPLSLWTWCDYFIFREAEINASEQSLNFTLTPEMFASNLATQYTTLDITATAPMNFTVLCAPSGQKAETLHSIVDDEYYTIGLIYGVYDVSFQPPFAWKVLNNGVYGVWRLTFGGMHNPGDINGDDKVDIFDVVIVAVAFGSRIGDPYWDSRADINGDGLVDIFDMVIVALHFGESNP